MTGLHPRFDGQERKIEQSERFFHCRSTSPHVGHSNSELSRCHPFARLYSCSPLATETEGIKLDLVCQEATKFVGWNRARFTSRLALDGCIRLFPDQFSARNFIEILHTAVVLHIFVVPAEHAKGVFRIGTANGQTED